jgi:hypothetical protein
MKFVVCSAGMLKTPIMGVKPRICRDGTLQGRCSVGSIRSFDIEGLDKWEEDSSLSLDRLRVDKNLDYVEKSKLLELIHILSLN